MTACATQVERAPAAPRITVSASIRPRGLPWLMAVELGSSVLGFLVVVHWARRLGPSGFAHVEYATAVAAWLLVVVRGGIELIVFREAARRPRLVHALTELLLGLKCASALVGYLLVLAVGWLVGGERGWVVAVAGLVLWPSALVADVGLRASGRLGWVALAQALRAVGYLALGLVLVSRPRDAWLAAACGSLAEGLGWLVPWVLHARQYGVPYPRFRRRAWLVLAHRGAIASLMRFGRVSLYGADLLVLGWWAGAQLGPYAAARRLVFALVGIGLVVPGAVAPALARAWLEGAARARHVMARAGSSLWALALPAAMGLAFTSGRWMPAFFGPGYRQGGPYLALVALRLPWLLSASFSQTALVACRRETEALRLVGLTAVVALLTIPASAALAGPWGVALAALAIELAGAAGGRVALGRLHVAPGWTRRHSAAAAGCLVMAAVCGLLAWLPLVPLCALACATYGLVFVACGGLAR